MKTVNDNLKKKFPKMKSKDIKAMLELLAQPVDKLVNQMSMKDKMIGEQYYNQGR